MIFVYDGTFEGFMSAVFDAYTLKIVPRDITISEEVQLTFETEFHRVETSAEKSDRVMAGMTEKIGGDFTYSVMNAFLSWFPDRALTIYRYIVLGFKMKDKILLMLDDDIVRKVNDMRRQVGREVNKLSGFLRFSVMENDVMYAEISPQNNCLTCLMPHFSDRMKGLPFLIHDMTYHQVGVYDTRHWYIRDAEGLQIPKYSADEMQYRRMWKAFYDTIGIDGRKNLKLRQQFMPLRYQKHMFEMREDYFLDGAVANPPPSITEMPQIAGTQLELPPGQ